jgi:hypothetical protein
MRLGIAILCLLPRVAAAQNEALARLQIEAIKLRTANIDDKDFDEAITPLRIAQRNWIESKLPKSRKELLEKAELLGDELDRDLKAAKIAADDAPESDFNPSVGFGYVSVNLRRFAELPDMAFVTASATIPCGAEDSVYGYKFDASGWTRVVDARNPEMGNADLGLSDPDSSGKRLLVIDWYSQQCTSSWRGMAYEVFRFDWDNGIATTALAGAEGVWLGDKPLFVLTPTEMTVEFSDSSVSVDVHHRTKIQRYAFTPSVRRIDPFALQPQDFAEEWLTRPWSEMESRSAPETHALHEALGGGFVLGDYLEVTQCAPDQPVWLVGFGIGNVKDKQLPQPQHLYVELRDVGDRHYRMESASTSRPAYCKAEPGHPNEEYPWLSEEEIRKLK